MGSFGVELHCTKQRNRSVQRWRSCSWPVEHIKLQQTSGRWQTRSWKEGNRRRRILQLSGSGRTCLLQPEVDGAGSRNNLQQRQIILLLRAIDGFQKTGIQH